MEDSDRVKRDIYNDYEHGGLCNIDLHLFSHAQNPLGLNIFLTLTTSVWKILGTSSVLENFHTDWTILFRTVILHLTLLF